MSKQSVMHRNKKGQFVSTKSVVASFDLSCSSVSTPPKKHTFLASYEVPYTARLTYTAYPNCCGAGIWNNFSVLPVGSDKTFDRAFKIELANLKQRMFNARNGMVSAIITKAQLIRYPRLHRSMVEAGFKVTHQTGNPNHNYATTLFHYSYVEPHATAREISNDELTALVDSRWKTPSTYGSRIAEAGVL